MKTTIVQFLGAILSIYLLMAGTTLTGTYRPMGQKEPKIPDNIKKILRKHGCTSCHQVSHRLYGPPFEQIAQRQYPDSLLFELIQNPRADNWPGYPPMPPNRSIGYPEVQMISKWLDSISSPN